MLNDIIRQKILQIGSLLIDQKQAQVIVEPRANKEGF